MEIFNINNLSFQYPETEEQVLENIKLTISEGSFNVLCGPSGSGKTTLLRMLKNELTPVGHQHGEIMYRQKLLTDWDDQTLIEEIGFVFQDPENQIVMEEVLQEMVFGLENLGFPHVEMRKRVAEMVHFFGMEDLLRKKTSELSGGQKQMLNLLSVLLLKPKVLLLDEPTSQLDPVAAKDLVMMLDRLNKEMGITIIIVEHRLEDLFSIADNVYFMQDGQIVYEGNSREVIAAVYRKQDKQFLSYLPSVARVYLEKEVEPEESKIPLNVKESREWLASIQLEPNVFLDIHSETDQVENDVILSIQKAYFQYDRYAPTVIKNLSLNIYEGEYFALVGGNGSGKTTLLKLCTGILKPQRGLVKFAGKDIHKRRNRDFSKIIAYLPQNPQTYFIQDTIEKEMIRVIEQNHIDDGAEKISTMLQVFQITHLRNRHPYDCSGGELQRAALACMLLSQPDILFIDEPTKGLDPISKETLAKLLNKLNDHGLTIVMVTHDIEFAAKHVDRCAMMFDGDISVVGTPDELFKGNYFYTTTINRATQMGSLPEVLTLEEALSEWPTPAHI